MKSTTYSVLEGEKMLNQQTFSFGQTVNYKALLKNFRQRYGSVCHYHVEFSVSTEVMLRIMNKMRQNPRVAEVAMVIPDESGRIWLHTKASYPRGVYRLMTGGLNPGESPHMALRREVREETGFDAQIERCLAVVTYNFVTDGESFPFTSYVFLTRPATGTPLPTDPNEAITNFQAVPANQLFATAQRLRSLNGKFSDWGNFRAVVHEVVGNFLTSKSQSANDKSGHQSLPSRF
jgi:8-oxo-dGTP pyrophosphatase MutT (NUDIX family)